MTMINHTPISSAGAESATMEGEHRQSQRQAVTVRWVAKITGIKGQELCLIRNISEGGVMANVYAAHDVGERIRLEIRSGQQLDGEIVWARDGCVGVHFFEKVDVSEMLKAASAERRGLRARAPRIEVYGSAHIKAGTRVYAVDLCDLSQGGVKVVLPEPIPSEREVIVSISGLEDRKSVIRWQKDGQAGLSFIRPISFDLLVEWLGAQLGSEQAA